MKSSMRIQEPGVRSQESGARITMVLFFSVF
jgi:hypothetical protein